MGALGSMILGGTDIPCSFLAVLVGFGCASALGSDVGLVHKVTPRLLGWYELLCALCFLGVCLGLGLYCLGFALGLLPLFLREEELA